MHIITQRIFIGDYQDAFNKQLLLQAGITHVINLSYEYSNPWSNIMKYYKIDIADHPDEDISRYFDSSFNFIDDALKDPKNKVLVHCMMGISRSVTIVCAYLIRKYPGMGVCEVIDFVKSKRPQAQPNQGFIFQLFQMRLKPFINKKLT